MGPRPPREAQAQGSHPIHLVKRGCRITPAPNQITVPTLNRLIGTPDCLAIVDTSIDPDLMVDPSLVPGAFRHPNGDLCGLVSCLDGLLATLMCQKERKLSQGLTDPLPSEGLQAERLESADGSHQSDRCNLDRMRDVFELHAPALNRVATIVPCSDTIRPESAPEAAGLLALPTGSSVQYYNNSSML